jgi:hypothetical protein
LHRERHGTADAVVWPAMFVRSLVLLPLFAACAGHATPTTMARLDSLPGEHVAREQRLESTEARPGPESKKPKTREWRQAETAAATAAAIVGSIFSTTKTVTIGVSESFDENKILDPHAAEGVHESSDKEEPETYDPNQLTPWVRLGKPDAR